MIALLVLLACSKAADVVDRVTDPDKMIHDYEWFHTARERADARIRQIATTRSMLEAEPNEGERRRIRIELAGQQQSCRELIADYNANAQKVTIGSFRGWSLPAHMNPEDCE